MHAYKSVRTCACVRMGVCFCVGETWQRGGTCFRCLIIMSWPGTHGQSLQSFSGISPSQSTGSSQLPQWLTIRALTRPKTGTMLMATWQQNSQLITPGPSWMIYLSLEGSPNMCVQCKHFITHGLNSVSAENTCRTKVAEKAKELPETLE